jgi:hypothetical protein
MGRVKITVYARKIKNGKVLMDKTGVYFARVIAEAQGKIAYLNRDNAKTWASKTKCDRTKVLVADEVKIIKSI